MPRRRVYLLSAWVVGSLLLATLLYRGGMQSLLSGLEAPLNRYLQEALDESHFSSGQDRVNDRAALERIGGQVNQALETLIETRSYAPYRNCRLQIVRIDDVNLSTSPVGERLDFSLVRNDVERPIVAALGCDVNTSLAVGTAGMLGLLFLAIAYFVPPPLAGEHRRWINALLGQGYSGEEAFAVVSEFPASALRLNTSQKALTDILHDPAQKNMGRVLALAADPRVARLPPQAVPWLRLGLDKFGNDIDSALRLADGPEALRIDLTERTLQIRGLPVPMSLTPLFYYAWYALRRLDGEGWVTNPPSNRPDTATGLELAELMSSFDGHAKAIRDLEQSGLKARTLDQNRSKIKEELVATLGEELAASYLFEAGKHEDGVQMSYRLALKAQSIQILQ